MNPRVEKLLKLPLYQRVAMLGCLLLLLVGLLVWFLGVPLYEELGQLKAESKRLDAEVAEKRLLAKNLDKYKAEFAKMEKRFEAALTRLPNQSEIPSLLTNLAGLAKDNGLEVIAFKPAAEVSKGFFAEVPADLSLKGTYHNVALFASAVSDLPRIVNLNNLSMGSAKVAGNQAVVSISTKVLTYRFVDSK